jgi:hypothetical protein
MCSHRAGRCATCLPGQRVVLPAGSRSGLAIASHSTALTPLSGQPQPLPPWPLAPLRAVVALSQRSPCQMSRPPTPRYRRCCVAMPRHLACVGRLRFVRPAPEHCQREPDLLSLLALSPCRGPATPIRRLATTSSQFPTRTASVSSPIAEQPHPT